MLSPNSKPLVLLARIFSYGKGRPVALVILLWLTSLNLLTEPHVGEPAMPLVVAEVAQALGTPFRTARQVLFDSYQRAFPRVSVSQPVTIVAIDEASLSHVGQWPWPRNKLAELVARIGAHEPAAIGLDMYMPEPDQTSPARVAANLPPDVGTLARTLAALPSHERVLGDVLAQLPSVLGAAGFDAEAYSTTAGMRTTPLNVTGGNALPHVRHYPRVLASMPELQAAASGQAVLSVELENGVVRRIPLVVAVGGQLVSGLAMEMLRVASGVSAVEVTVGAQGLKSVSVADLVVPVQPQGDIWLHYATLNSMAGRYVSAVDVLEGKVAPDQLAGKLILIGLTGSGLADVQTTALGEIVPGVEIQAQAMETLFDGRFLERPWWMKWAESAGMLLLGLLMIWKIPQTDSTLSAFINSLPRASMLLTLLFNLVIMAAGYGLFRKAGLLFDAASFVIVVSSVMGSLIASAKVEFDRQARLLVDEQARLEKDRALLATQLTMTWTVQFSGLANAGELFADERRFSVAVAFEPTSKGGSDFFDHFMLDERQLCFFLGRVPGQGISASRLAVVVRTLLKSLVRRTGSPQAALVLLREEMIAERLSYDDLVVILGVLDVETGRMQVSNRRGPCPWHIATDASLTCLTEDDVQIKLEMGDLLLAVCPGVTSAAAKTGQPLEMLIGNAALQAEEMRPAQLLEGLRRTLMPEEEVEKMDEDVTMLVFRLEPGVSTIAS